LSRSGSGSPEFADEFVSSKGFEPPAEIVGVHEVGEMPAKLSVIIGAISLDGRILDRAVHALDLAVLPRMVQLGDAMLDAVLLASHSEHMRQKIVRSARRRNAAASRTECR